MKKIFYGNLVNVLHERGGINVVTIINGIYNGKDIVGQKLLKSENDIIIEDESLKDFWNFVLKTLDFTKGTCVVKLENNIELFIEYVVGEPHLVICGGGHIALPLCNIAKMLDFNVTIIDDRIEFANNERFPIADKVFCNDFNEAIEEIKPNKSTYFVIITRGHKDDRKCLEKILQNDFFYVGMIGSKSKVAFVINNMLESGYTKEQIDKVHTPIGLSLGGQTPAEIAVSIAGEIILEKNKKESSNIEDNILNEILNRKESMVLTTIIEKHGSSPRGVGAKMLVYENGEFIGTVGGGSVENAVYEQALDLVKCKKSLVEKYDLSNSAASKLGMACGGTIKVLFEFIDI
ncbi:MAG: XdhC family protein [Clostridium beijerinckii]|jgi:xanthine dehydrogenase accessory factor|uniref:XdhC family protein n=1 Tax=Clostridium beijerinckii TaxID=1520 RepID=UPI0024332E1B|nr:XdhC family protein [Clostridium beijerinckii]MCI1478363.1 XdhC family protein [Clostridium beijerinckii]MCI1579088.1 XdhC family protein [Clostridium beijerinckii]MCI1582845.1 XdhC family protein [Clostridium beijerinckii]MCI1623895.1 XdhC family protein [Clostridium beijerinckii]MDG5855298.1 XdhC family protein [Clostridium beijerinckii]